MEEANIEPPFDGDMKAYFILNNDVKEKIVYYAYVEGCAYRLVLEKYIADVDTEYQDNEDDEDDDESIINGYRLVMGLRVYLHD